MFQPRIFVCTSLALALLPADVKSHGGGLDDAGCHNDRQASEYHCHRGPLAGRNFQSETEARAALSLQTSDEEGRALVATSVSGTDIVGRASVIDGDTIEIRGDRIRLYGIDAPESGQSCQDATGASFRCGQTAANVLADRLGVANLVCKQRDIDRYQRIVAVCRLDGVDINEWIVREGWAVAYRQYSTDYVAAEEQAKMDKRGLWSGTFINPADWRRR